jgi:hypothetical protein
MGVVAAMRRLPVRCMRDAGGLRPEPLVPYSTDTPPLVLVSPSSAAVIDNARFREIYCAILEARKELPRQPTVRRRPDTSGRKQPERGGRSTRPVATASRRSGGAGTWIRVPERRLDPRGSLQSICDSTDMSTC